MCLSLQRASPVPYAHLNCQVVERSAEASYSKSMSISEDKTRLDEAVKSSGLTMKAWYRKVYLASDHWSELRSRALQILGKRCSHCGECDSILDVHHLNYRNIFDVLVSDLQVLCRSCHATEHARLRRSVSKRKKLSIASELWATYHHAKLLPKPDGMKIFTSIPSRWNRPFNHREQALSDQLLRHLLEWYWK